MVWKVIDNRIYIKNVEHQGIYIKLEYNLPFSVVPTVVRHLLEHIIAREIESGLIKKGFPVKNSFNAYTTEHTIQFSYINPNLPQRYYKNILKIFVKNLQKKPKIDGIKIELGKILEERGRENRTEEDIISSFGLYDGNVIRDVSLEELLDAYKEMTRRVLIVQTNMLEESLQEIKKIPSGSTEEIPQFKKPKYPLIVPIQTRNMMKIFFAAPFSMYFSTNLANQILYIISRKYEDIYTVGISGISTARNGFLAMFYYIGNLERLPKILEEADKYRNNHLVKNMKESLKKSIENIPPTKIGMQLREKIMEGKDNIIPLMEILGKSISEGYFAVMYPAGRINFVYELLNKIRS